jgi:hypothetical protein
MLRSKLKSRFRRVLRMTFFWAVLALLLHLVPGTVDPTRAQSSRKDDIVFNSRGIPLAGAAVRVCTMPATGQPRTPLAQIYSDSSFTQALANPTAPDGLGNYFFYAAPGKYMIEVSGPDITTKQIPNVILPSDPSSPTFTGASNAFSLNLTGDLTVNGSTTVLGNLASSTLYLTNQGTAPGAASSGSVSLYAKSSDKKLYYKDETSAETGPLGIGRGASPGGNNGDLQSKSGTSLQASGINDNGTTLAINRDQQSAGPNPHFDLRAFGGYIAVTPGTMTCNINSGSTTLRCTSNPDFNDASGITGSSVGHGVVVPGAGALPTITTPGTPTVTQTNVLNGSTTWNYKVIAEDYKGGLTAATAAGTTTGGASGLGATTFAIASGTRTGGVTTYTTGSAHNLQAGTTVMICQFGGGACPGTFGNAFNGTKVVASTPTSTTFTTNDGNVPDGAESPASGLGNVMACNTLTFPANSYSGAGTLRYWIYRSHGAGAFALQGVAVGLDPYFVDCGGAAPGAPSYVPSTPPASAQAGYLATTIVSGGGTTSMTLAAAAGTTVSNVTVVHDNSSALIAAGQAAAGQGGGIVYIPSFPNNGGTPIFWVFNSLTNFSQITSAGSNYITVLVNGHIGLTQPWVLRSNVKIEGTTKRNSSFMYPGGALVGGSAQPLILIPTKSSIYLRNLFINPQGPQSTGVYADNDGGGNGSVGIVLENVGVGVQNGRGYGQPMIFKGGFDYLFRQVTCDGAFAGTNFLPRPCIRFTNSSTATFNGVSQTPGRVAFDAGYVAVSGIQVDTAPNMGAAVTGFRFNAMLAESLYTPFLRIGPMGFGTDYNLIDVLDSDQVTGAGTPIVEASGSQVQGVSINGGIITGGTPPMLISGHSQTTLHASHPPSQNNGNTPWFSIGVNSTEVNNQPLNARGTGRVTYSMATPGALTSCVVGAGGAVPIGTQSYSVTAVDHDNNETVIGRAVSVTTTSGNQTVTCNLPALPSGAKGFNGYRNGFRFNNGGCTSPQLTGTTLVDTNASGCGNGAPNISSAGSSFLSSTGISTHQLRLNGDALTGTTGNGNLAASSRGSFSAGHLPVFDANSNVMDSGISPASVSDSFNRAAGNLGSETNSPWTVQAGTLLVTGGGVGGTTTSQNYAVFTGVGFPNDDQSVGATWVKSGTPSAQTNALTLRGSPTALTNYNCAPSNTGTSLSIGKFVSGSFTGLASQSTTIRSGDIISFNVTGTSLNCYVNGVPIVAATDSSITSGFPGLGAFQTYNANSANLQWKNWMASPGYVSLRRPQTWSQVQTFSPGIAIGTEQVSASPRGPFNAFFPGALTSTWTAQSWTLDKAITVTRVQVQPKTAPAGCTTNALIRLTDGTTNVNLTITAAANDSGAISQNYSAGVTLTLSVQTAAAGCTTSPADANAVVQYRMQ